MSKGLLKTFLLLATFSVYYLVMKPLYTGAGGVIQPEQSIVTLQNLNKQHDDTLSQAESLVKKARDLQQNYNNISDKDKQDMSVMVPDSMDQIRLLNEVRNLGQDAGFDLANLTYANGTISNSRSSASISFAVKTTYPRFKELMANFEKSKRLYSIQDISFTSPDKEGDLIMFNVKLVTYYLNK